MNPDKYQQAVIDEYARTNRNIFVEATAGCLGKDVPILMFDGSVKMSQNITVGDVLMGPDSTPRNVISVKTGRSNMYRIVPVKGMEWTCNDSHIMVVHDQYISRSMRLYNTHHKTDIVDRNIADILRFRRSDNSIGHLKLVRTGVEFPEVNTGIDPYLLGLWLAEGTKGQNSPTFTIYKEDTDILEYLRNYPLPTGVSIKEKPDGESCVRVRFLGAVHTFNREFKENCVDDTGMVSIPKKYLINSRKNRLRLLAGLLDGDGYLSKNGFSISTKFEQLGKDIIYLCKSLGFQCKGRWKKSTILSRNFEGYYYRIFIYGHTDQIPNVLKRKHAKERRQIKDVLHTDFSVYDIGVGDWYGFTVDGDNRYLLGDFTITHNSGKTTTLIELSKRTPPIRDSIFLAFNKSIAQELANRLPPDRKAQTLHSCALSALRRAYKIDIDITDSKYFYMALEGLKWPEKQSVKQRMSVCSKVARLYDLMRVNCIYGGEKEVFSLGLRYGEEVSDEIVDRAIKLHAIATQAADRYFYSNAGGKLKMDFTDMLTFAIKYVPDRDFKKYSVVMTDEIQDLNPLQYELIKRLKSPNGRLIGVGDQRQSIYSFQGSNLDTLNAIRNAPNTVSLPLSMTYRCARAIVNKALEVFPNGIEAAPFAKEGEVREGDVYEAQEGDFVLCRNNAPLVDAFIGLLKKGRRAQILGKEFGQEVVDMIDSVNEIWDLEKKLQDFENRLSSKGIANPMKVPAYSELDDRVNVLISLYLHFGSLEKVRQVVEEVFTDKPDYKQQVTLSTIHKSKGLEADRVFFLNSNLIPSKFATSELELYAEDCLKFVAITRAKNSLIYCNIDNTK